ncbi:hypothetical protein Tchar_02593 [Tepidimonas charontis]|uniref:Uncharacterized protein n=1 Tax=Tepidimonas charontis TaxID=2267262 RepID=A0A554X0L4_9BURK|nr:hypothetical protein Tchar_02593 [Tepidimonas charontis]
MTHSSLHSNVCIVGGHTRFVVDLGQRFAQPASALRPASSRSRNRDQRRSSAPAAAVPMRSSSGPGVRRPSQTPLRAHSKRRTDSGARRPSSAAPRMDRGGAGSAARQRDRVRAGSIRRSHCTARPAPAWAAPRARSRRCAALPRVACLSWGSALPELSCCAPARRPARRRYGCPDAPDLRACRRQPTDHRRRRPPGPGPTPSRPRRSGPGRAR